MGQVIVRYRILPDSPDNFEELKKALESLEPASMEEEPIAFGLKAIKFVKVVEDSPRAEEDLENRVKAIPHVETVETISVTRSL
jgi:elongation factor 1-beta